MMQVGPPASLKDIASFMMPINGVAGVFNSSTGLSFQNNKVSISESIVFENIQMGPSTGLMVMFLYQSHMIMMNVVGVSTLSALSADSELTSTLSGISFQTVKPSDVGSSGDGGQGGGGQGGGGSGGGGPDIKCW